MTKAPATDWGREQLDRFRVQILNTVGATRDAYTRGQEQRAVPETVTVQRRQNERAAAEDREWTPLQPAFIVVSRRTDGTLGASIVDPPGAYLADARAKLQALAAFAERFDDRFVRIESVAKVEDGSLRVLDLADPTVRAEV